MPSYMMPQHELKAISDEEIKEMIALADRKGNGWVDLEDFLFVMESAGLLQDEESKVNLKPTSTIYMQQELNSKMDGILQ